MYVLKDRSVLVAGGAGYLGESVCRKLVAEGAKVMIADMAINRAKALAAELSQNSVASALAIELNVNDVASIRNAVSQTVDAFGRIDSLITMTYAATGKLIEEIQPDELDRVFHTHLTGTFLLVREVADQFADAGGSIVVFSSMYGHVAPDPRMYAPPMKVNPIDYGIAKAGIDQMIRYLAVYWGPRNIRINGVAPGPFPNAGNSDYRIDPDYQAFEKRLADRVPLGRVGQPHEIAGSVAFLVSDDNTFVTGQILSVDGGWGCW